MKKVGVLILALLFMSMFSFVLAVDTPPAPGGTAEEDMEDIQNVVDKIPIDDEGQIDDEQITGFKSKAEERIAKINEYVGPITNVVFGVELTLSWVFVFAVILWILLIELIVMPVSSIFDFNIWLSLLGSAIIATLAMQGLSDTLVIWIDSLINTWWVGVLAVFSALIVGMVYAFVIQFAGEKIKSAKEKAAKEKTSKSRQIIQAHGEISKKELESYKK